MEHIQKYLKSKLRYTWIQYTDNIVFGIRMTYRSIILQVLANISTSKNGHTIHLDDYHMKIVPVDVNTTLINQTHQADEYDSDGAMWFVVATILIYAMSIMIMVAANLSRSLADDEVKKFLKSYTAIDLRKCEKNKVKLSLTQKGIQLESLFEPTPPSTPETGYSREDTEELETDLIDNKRKLQMQVKHKRLTRGFSFPIREEGLEFEEAPMIRKNSFSTPNVSENPHNG